MYWLCSTGKSRCGGAVSQGDAQQMPIHTVAVTAAISITCAASQVSLHQFAHEINQGWDSLQCLISTAQRSCLQLSARLCTHLQGCPGSPTRPQQQSTFSCFETQLPNP